MAKKGKRRKIKHDLELERMAKELMKLPFNRRGADKTGVLEQMEVWAQQAREGKKLQWW